MKLKSKKRTFFLWVVLVFCLWLISNTVTPFWNGCGSCYYVDLHTGRLRDTKYTAFIKTHDEIQETDISKLWRQCFGAYPKAEWQMIGRFPLGCGGHSVPDYPSWNFTPWQDSISGFFTDFGFQLDDATKKEMISSFFGFLENHDPQSCGNYSGDLLAFALDHRGEPMTNLPAWITKPELHYKRRD